jgi:hypothetical protein
MSAEKLYSEIFEEFNKASTKQERLNVLKKYDHPMFRLFLQAAFHPNVQFDVAVPKWRPAPEPAGLNFTYLDSEMSKIYRYVKDHPARPAGLTDKKKSELLLVTLESLHKDEAHLLEKLVKKDLSIKHLTPKLVEEAFPGLL